MIGHRDTVRPFNLDRHLFCLPDYNASFIVAGDINALFEDSSFFKIIVGMRVVPHLAFFLKAENPRAYKKHSQTGL